MSRAALYPGSFDPITVGHTSVIARGTRIFDEVVVGIARNISKKPMFTLEERIAFIEGALSEEGIEGVRIEVVDGLLVEEARRLGCGAILRGLRAVSDFDYELRMTTMNRELAPEVETVFVMTEADKFHISSSLIKEVARFGGDVTRFVTAEVAGALEARRGE
jgi:pantetheine-phosphate adenylyltransferase